MFKSFLLAFFLVFESFLLAFESLFLVFLLAFESFLLAFELFLLVFLLTFELLLVIFEEFFLALYLSVFHIPVNFLAQTVYVTGHLRQNLMLIQFIISLFILFVVVIHSCVVRSNAVIRRRLGWNFSPVCFHGGSLLLLFFLR